MALPPVLSGLRLPVVGAPLFIVSNPDLVIAQCKAGIVGAFPALNAREKPGDEIQLEVWLKRITEELDRYNQANPDTPAAPYAVNQIVHRSNARLERDIEICHRWKVPVWITSLGARVEVNQAAHHCGGITLHDIINNRFAKKAIEKGADGLIAGGGRRRRACGDHLALCADPRDPGVVRRAPAAVGLDCDGGMRCWRPRRRARIWPMWARPSSRRTRRMRWPSTSR